MLVDEDRVAVGIEKGDSRGPFPGSGTLGEPALRLLTIQDGETKFFAVRAALVDVGYCQTYRKCSRFHASTIGDGSLG